MTARRRDTDLGVGRAPGTRPGRALEGSARRTGPISPALLLLAAATVGVLVALLIVAIAGSGKQSALTPQQNQRLDQLTVSNAQPLMRKLSH